MEVMARHTIELGTLHLVVMEPHVIRLVTLLYVISFMMSLFIAAALSTAHLHPEAAYRDAWCMGQTEVRMPNGNRADCITTSYAVEVEFAGKYHEGVGQALDYAQQTGKKPAILLIIESEKDWRHYNKLKPLAAKEGIRLWYITPRRLQ